MSPAEKNIHSSQTRADQSIETIYTTVESQRDQTDWLTVVSNLRQINRHLVEEIARLEEALASAKQTLHTHKEANQTHEITILQQQDELRIAQDRVGALFQQLETSHQIGQRQQTLIETLSELIEIVRSIVPQIETEHEELRQKYQLQSQKLTKTERVAVELHRRLQLQSGVVQATLATTATTPNPVQSEPNPIIAATLPAKIVTDRSTSAAATELAVEIDPDPNPSTTDVSSLKLDGCDSDISITEIEPAPPLAPLQIPDLEMSGWIPSAPTLAQTTILSPSKPAAPTDWREAIPERCSTTATPDSGSTSTLPLPGTVDRESTAIDDLTAIKSPPNWPAPTIDRDRSIAKTVKIDLPKFPKKQGD